MPTIHGPTDRGLRLLPGLTAGQGLGLLASAAAAWLFWRTGWSTPLRLAAASSAVVGGGAYAIARWPVGPAGERLAVWLPRIVRYLRAPRSLAGSGVSGWDGLRGIHGHLLRHRAGWAAVLEVGGADFSLRGPGAQDAAEAAFRELLHALGSPLQVVNASRALIAADRPACWDPARAPAGLGDVAAAYAAHWAGLVGQRRAYVRRCLLVFSAEPDAAGDPEARLAAVTAAAAHFGRRTGIPVRCLGGEELVALLREAGGAADRSPGGQAGGPWTVGRGHV